MSTSLLLMPTISELASSSLELMLSSKRPLLLVVLSGVFRFKLLKSVSIESVVIVAMTVAGDCCCWWWCGCRLFEVFEMSEETLFWGTFAKREGTGDNINGHELPLLLLLLLLFAFELLPLGVLVWAFVPVALSK